jgi:predicted AAA+ superfamily ATPase
MSDKKLWGRWVESCIGAHLLAYADSDLEIFYWNESNAEVDFILKWEEKYVALEVKLNHDKVTGIDKFKKQFRPHKVYQLDSRGLSWQEFITMDPRELF